MGRTQGPYQRSVTVMERRPAFSRLEDDCERGSDYDYDYNRGRGGYHGDNQRSCHGERGVYSGERRCGPAHRREDSYSYYRGAAEQSGTARQAELRSSSRATLQPSIRGQRLPPPRSVSMSGSHRGDSGAVHGFTNSDQGDECEGLKRRAPFPPVREHSPVKREAASSHHMRSSRSYSPDCGKASPSHPSQPKKAPLHQGQEKERPPSLHVAESRDGSPHSSVSAAKDDGPGCEAEQSEEMKTKEDPEQTIEARRAHVIANKALEIEKLYRQDCETFGMVVKMLVAKQPSLETQLEAALKENLMEIKERCLEDLRHFISEVNLVLKSEQPS